MPNFKNLQSIIDSYLNCNNRSENEVRSKFAVPLIEWLEYPLEFRAEEFPVYGFSGSKKLPTKLADFLLFDDKDYKNYDKFRTDHIEWVQKHSLLVVETKKPEEMPTVLGQPQFYTIWTKAIAYIVTDGIVIKGYIFNPTSADTPVVDCYVKDLCNSESIKHFLFSEIKAIKDIDLTKEIQARINDEKLEEKTIDPDEIKLPENIMIYMRSALGNNSIGLSNGQLLEKFLRSTDFYLQQDIRYDIPGYMFDIPREVSEGWICLNDNIIPYMSGDIYQYYRNDLEMLEFQNKYLHVGIILSKDSLVELWISFQVHDYHVSERIYNLSRIEKVLEANVIKLIYKCYKRTIDIPVDQIYKDGTNIGEQLEIIHFWQNCMNQLKTIEEYYGIEFILSPVYSPEETEKLYNNIKIVYEGIAKERNIWLCEEKENYFNSLSLVEPITLTTEDIKKLPSITIHNYLFTEAKERDFV